MKYKLAFMLMLFSLNAFAWNSVGHRIIAQIAYDQLTPTAKEKVDALTQVMFHSRYPEARFARASTWPDQIKTKTNAYNTWHYINLPYVKNNITPAAVNPENVVWAIARSEKIISNTNNSTQERAEYLSFLIHFMGDITQPLHCTTFYDTQFPHGDHGGNDYLIHSPISHNLHHLWDRGLGLFVANPDDYQFHYNQIQTIATQWMQAFPRDDFKSELTQTDPMAWAMQSHEIAVNFVYTLPENTAPSSQYISEGQLIVKKQIVLAGDRLADELNRLF